jgi:hypothetical protein
MTDDEQLQAIVEELKSGPAKKSRSSAKALKERTQLAPDAPAPRLGTVVAEHGEEPTTRALEAWNARLAGHAIIDIAHDMGVSIELAKSLLREVHAAIYEDLKENIDLNRQLDLGRIDSIIKAHLPIATGGDEKSAAVVLRAIGQRAQLTGAVAAPDPGRGPGPTNVLLWIQNQLPGINRIVDSLPAE